MKLLLSTLLALLTLTSCVQESVDASEDLTPEEREEIRRRAQEKCLDEERPDFDYFSQNSTNHIHSLYKGDGWELKYQSTVKTIRVWKTTANAVYFLIQEDSGNITNQFVKIPTEFNTQMGQDFLKKKCDKVMTISAGTSLTVKRTEKNIYQAPNYYDREYTHSITKDFPVFLLTDKFKLAKKKLKESGSSHVLSTENFESTITKVDRADSTWVNLNYGQISNPQLCIVNYTGDQTNKNFVFPYTMSCANNAAPNNPGSDTNLDFLPSEL